MERSYYKSPKPGIIMKFLWDCCGADSYILKRSTYSDHVKYACLGGIVLATGCMAALAGGYAFFIVFEPRGEAVTAESAGLIESGINYYTSILATIFGILWGLIIFNIDRFIVASTGKGDGTEAITWNEVKTAVPRVIMGIIIAITISKPMEIRMFETEIDNALHKRQLQDFQANQKEVSETFQPKIDEISDEIEFLRQEIIEKEVVVESLRKEWQQETYGDGGSGIAGRGPLADAAEAYFNLARAELDALKLKNNADVEEKKNELEEQKEKKTKEMGKSQAISNNLNGLLIRIQLAHEIAGTFITLFITLLFVTIELTPIFFKMMLIKSPYDFMDDNIKDLIKAEQGIEVKYDFYKDQKGVQRNLVINHQSEKLIKEKMKLIQTQNELSDFIIEKWKKEEKDKIDKNPEDYIEKA